MRIRVRQRFIVRVLALGCQTHRAPATAPIRHTCVRIRTPLPTTTLSMAIHPLIFACKPRRIGTATPSIACGTRQEVVPNLQNFRSTRTPIPSPLRDSMLELQVVDETDKVLDSRSIPIGPLTRSAASRVDRPKNRRSGFTGGGSSQSEYAVGSKQVEGDER